MKAFALILVTSAIFLAPFGFLIYKVYQNFCLGPNPGFVNPFNENMKDWNTTGNTFSSWLKYSNGERPDFCPIKENLYTRYEESGEASFCRKTFPNYYSWIQNRYWGVMFFSFV